MARKQVKVSKGMVFTWLILAGLIFLFAPQSLTNRFQFAFAHIFQWPLSMTRGILLSARTQQLPADMTSSKECQLQNHIANIEEQLQQERQKVEKLSGLRNRFPLEGANLIVADIIKASVDSSHNELTINRGESDGLAKGQFVLGINNIIGTVSDVSAREAKVKLITDVTSKMEVKVGSSLERLMRGSGNNLAKIPMVPAKHKVKIGEKVYARKKPGFLDAPMIIGTVTECKKDDKNPLILDITVKPACDIESLKDVAVIIMNPKSS